MCLAGVPLDVVGYSTVIKAWSKARQLAESTRMADAGEPSGSIVFEKLVLYSFTPKTYPTHQGGTCTCTFPLRTYAIAVSVICLDSCVLRKGFASYVEAKSLRKIDK